MQITLPFNKSAEISFNMDISGTSAKPNSVQLSLEQGSTVLAFKAYEYGSGQWKAVVNEAGLIFGAGTISFSINVLINNRLLTPYKGVAVIENDQTVSLVPEINVQPQISVQPLIPATFEEVKKEIEKVVTEQAEEIKETIVPVLVKQPTEPVTPVPIITPKIVTKLPLLKTIESVKSVETKPVLQETKKPAVVKKSDPLFKVKKVKVVYK